MRLISVTNNDLTLTKWQKKSLYINRCRKISDKIQHTFIVEIPNEMEREGASFNLIMHTHMHTHTIREKIIDN